MTKVLTFKSRPNLKFLFLAVLVMMIPIYLINRGFFVHKILPNVPLLATVYFVIGGFCLLVLLYFSAQHIIPKKVVVDENVLKIQYGTKSYKVPWKDVRSITHSRRFGGKAFFVLTNDHTFHFMESDFPNFKVLGLAFSQIKEHVNDAKFLELQ